jgi:hypothetical protein
MKIVINSCYGSFNLSDYAFQLYKERANVPEHIPLAAWDIPRNDETLIAIVEELDQQSWGQFSTLKVVEIPDDVEWEICDYDGDEWVAEKHRKWS